MTTIEITYRNTDADIDKVSNYLSEVFSDEDLLLIINGKAIE